jgi:hypothetical protein
MGWRIRIKAKPICKQEKLVRVRSLDTNPPTHKRSTIGAEGKECDEKIQR